MSSWNTNDRTGKRYGKLLVIERAQNAGSGRSSRARWLCRCDCGSEKVILAGSLGKNTFSCGCLQREATATSNMTRIKHGHARGHKPSPEWRSWKSMLDRCYLPSNPNFHHYGGKGITVCPEWQGKDGFIIFLRDMGSRPSGKTLDRIDGSKGYDPNNCRWATASEQSRNRKFSPETTAARNALLAEWREKTWADPDLRSRLLESRRKKQA